MPENKHFWEFRNSAESSENAELVLYGDISSVSWWGDEVTPKIFSDELKALGDIKSLTVRINSGGGDVFAAFGIYSRLIDLRNKGVSVNAVIDGWAASAATIICMGAEKISISDVGLFMIHNPKAGVYGHYSSSELEKISSELDIIKKTITAAYAGKTGKSNDEINKDMDAETWLDGAAAVESGYCDELISVSANVENKNGHIFVNSIEMKNVPENVLNRITHYGSAPRNSIIGVSGLNKKTGNIPVVNKTTTEVKQMAINTAAELKAAYPELCGEIEASAAAAERKRIQDIEESAVSGYEDIITDAKFKNPVSAEQTAVKILAKMKKQGAEYLSERQTDARNSGAEGVSSEPEPEDETTKDDKDFKDALKAVFGDKK